MDSFNKWFDENIEKYQFFEWKVTDLARNAYLKGVEDGVASTKPSLRSVLDEIHSLCVERYGVVLGEMPKDVYEEVLSKYFKES